MINIIHIYFLIHKQEKNFIILLSRIKNITKVKLNKTRFEVQYFKNYKFYKDSLNIFIDKNIKYIIENQSL
jgi:hypothetical protein